MVSTYPLAIHLPVATTGLLQEASRNLAAYLQQMFGIQVIFTPYDTTSSQQNFRLILGTNDDPQVRVAYPRLEPLTSQEHLLRRLDERTMLLVGGSQQAAAWAVYAFAELYGVRYLLHRDLVPRHDRSFYLPDIDQVYQPVHKIRSWRQLCELATGPLMWSLDQQKSFITQLFKLRFNGIYLSVWPTHPFIDLEVDGLRLQRFRLLFGQRFPIDNKNIGRKHLIDAPLLTNPDFVGAEERHEILHAGRRLIQGIIHHAKTYDMHVALAFSAFEFPKEFAGYLENASNTVIQAGDLTCTEQGHLDNPGHLKLIRAQFQAYLDQFSDVDDLYFGLPEHPHADRYAVTAWRELSRTYSVDQLVNYQALLERAKNDHLTCGGPDRATRTLKSTVSFLHFLNKFMGSNSTLLKQAERQDTRLGLNMGIGIDAELFSVLDRVLWPNAVVNTPLDYTAARAVRRMDSLHRLNTSRVAGSLIITLQDDNIGSIPQNAVGSLDILFHESVACGWEGFSTRYWPIGDLDPAAAFLAKASWGRTVTPSAVYDDHFTHLYGPEAAPVLTRVMHMLEDATNLACYDGPDMLFPVEKTTVHHFTGKSHRVDKLVAHVTALYCRCEEMLAQCRPSADRPWAKEYLQYLRSRLRFSIEAMAQCVLAGRAATELKEWWNSAQLPIVPVSSGVPKTIHRLRQIEATFEMALEAGERAIEAMASCVRDDSDRASLAAYFHLLVREPRQVVATQKEEARRLLNLPDTDVGANTKVVTVDS